MNSSTAHGAKYNPRVLERIRLDLDEGRRDEWGTINVLDPFAGVGTIHQLRQADVRTYAVELEKEWADQSNDHGQTWCGDFFDFEHPDGWPTEGEWHAVITSPTYGNRMADHHDAKDDSTRNTYKAWLGHDPTDGSSAVMQWGPAYRDFHAGAWLRVHELLTTDGLFILNVKDHVRRGCVQPVAKWHEKLCITPQVGFKLEHAVEVSTRGLPYGANADVRVDHEMVMVFRRIEVDTS